MSKKLQRKKQLRNSLRRSGAFSTTVTKVVEETKNTVVHFSLLNSDEVKKVRERAFRLSKKALWQHFITYYYKAYNIALRKAEARKENELI